MKVSVVRGGGLAGLVQTTSVDSESLAPDQAAALRAKVDEAGVFDLPPRLGQASTTPEAFDYELTVEEGERRHTVRASGEALPEQVRALIEWTESAPGREERLEPPGG